MPELPDVAVFKQYLDATALHQDIDETEVFDDQVLSEISADRLDDKLRGKSLERSRRHGKYLFAQVNTSGWLLMHFGMSGRLEYYKNGEPPEYTQVLLRFTNGYNLAYLSIRKLGRVGIAKSVDDFVEEEELGPDAMDPDFDLETFLDAVSGRHAMAKSTLMNQSVIAGIGNVYSDEILFQAGTHPRSRIDKLDGDKLEKLSRTMRDVLDTAIDHNADPDDFPSSYIIPQRHEDGKCPRCGGALQRVDVAGRTGYFCPCRQGQGPD